VNEARRTRPARPRRWSRTPHPWCGSPIVEPLKSSMSADVSGMKPVIDIQPHPEWGPLVPEAPLHLRVADLFDLRAWASIGGMRWYEHGPSGYINGLMSPSHPFVTLSRPYPLAHRSRRGGPRAWAPASRNFIVMMRRRRLRRCIPTPSMPRAAASSSPSPPLFGSVRPRGPGPCSDPVRREQRFPYT